MSPKTVLVAFGASAAAFLLLDAIWLTLMADRLYRPVLGDTMEETVRIAPAVAFYLIYLAGVTLLVVLPAIAADSRRKALANGALLGFVAYATYDLTNQATLRTWSITLTLVDLVWGTVLTALAAYAGYWAGRRA